MTAFRLLMISSLFFVPISAYASPCEDITEQIKHDTDQYGEAITKYHLPWMCLSWLQQKMGSGSTKITNNNQISHTWVCSSTSDSKLIVLTNNEGKLTQIDGLYSSDHGAGMFSTLVNVECSKNNTNTAANEPPQKNKAADSVPTPDSNSTTACDSTAEQIYDIAAMSLERPYSHPAFPWENKGWLENAFGKPKINVSSANTSYIWHCQRDIMTTVAYSEVPQGDKIQLATICKGSNCYLATVSRTQNVLHGSIKTINPKPI